MFLDRFVFVFMLLDLDLVPAKTFLSCKEDLISMVSCALLLPEVLGFLPLFC
jgi:hypothetical protein